MEHAPGVHRHPPGDPHRPTALAAIAWAGGGVFVLSLGYFVYSYFQRFGVAVEHGPRLAPLTIDVALFSAFALHHSIFARTGAKAWTARLAGPLERSMYTWIASLLFIAVCWLWQPVGGVLYRWASPLRPVAYTLQIAGFLLTFFGARALDVLDLAGVRAVLRARTRSDLAHVPLSTTGVFGIVRHPLYFGWALLVWGAADMTATRAVFAVVSCAYVAIAIAWEERGLVETFGDDYERYRRQVRWRMIPFVY